MAHLILASQSPRRMDLLRTCGIDYVAVSACIPEETRMGERPSAAAVRLARGKAEAVREKPKMEQYYILAADTVVVDGEQILGKPTSQEQSRAFLEQLRGRMHKVVSGVCLFRPGEIDPALDFVETTVCMRNYSPAEVDAYLASGDDRDKAGAYAIQHPIFRPVSSFRGCYTNVIGLPVCCVYNMLTAAGWKDMRPLPDGCRGQTQCGFSGQL